MLTLGTAGNTIQGVTTAAATAITYTFFGDEFTSGTTDSFKVLAQGQLPTSVTALYTVPATTQTIVKAMQLFNTTGAIVNFTLYVNGAVAANSIGSINIPANGTAIWESNGWTVRDVNGATFTTANLTLTGDVTGSGSGAIATTLATVTTGATVGDASHVAQMTYNAKGLTTSSTAVPIAITSAAVSGLTFFATLANLSGDVTTAGSGVTTLATVNSNLGTFGGPATYVSPTVNAKGLITAITSGPIAITSTQVSGLGPLATATNLSGDVTTAGSGVTTLATVNANVGTFGTASNVSTITVNAKGLITAASNTPIAITSGAVSGLTFFATLANLSGDVSTAGSGVTTLATVNAITGAVGGAAVSAVLSFDVKGRVASISNAAIQIAESAVTNLTTDLAAKQAGPLTGDVTTSGAAATLSTVNSNVGTFGDINHVPTVTVSGKGLTTAVSQTILPPMNGWIDVTNQAAPVNGSNTAAVNITNMNAILVAAPSGSTIYFPGGTYSFNAAWTMPASKAFNFQGQGSGVQGGNTLLQWTSNVGGTWITLASSEFYQNFSNLTFISTGVAQTAGAVVDVNGNAGISFQNCTFSGLSGGFLNDVLVGTATGFGQSWNSSLVSNCDMSSFKGRGIFSDANNSSLVIENCVIQGAWGPSSGGIFTGSPGITTQAAAGIQINAGGAFQINACDILGSVNNVLFAPTTGEVNASVFCNGTYFDNAGGSCIKITGVGATQRVRFDTCSFTTAGTNYSTPGSGFTAFEISTTYPSYTTTAGQGIDIVNCNILNTFATSGTTNGFLISGAADFSIGNCRVAGWTNGIQITPNATTGTTKPMIVNNSIGPAGGYGGNATGILFNGGGNYGPVNVIGNQLAGNTAIAINDSALVLASTPGSIGAQKVYAANSGLWSNSRNAQPAATTATTTEVQVLGSNFPAFGAVVNQMFRVTCMATMTANAATVTFRLRFGPNSTTADTLLATLVSTTTAAATTVQATFLVAVTAVGATGTLRINGYVQNWTATAVAANQIGIATVTPTVNTTVLNYLGVCFLASAGTLTNVLTIIEPITQT